MDKINDVCCEWKSECEHHHDRLLYDLSNNNPLELFNKMRDEVEDQNNHKVLPYDQIPAIHFGKMAQAHADELTEIALVIAHAAAAKHKPRTMDEYLILEHSEAGQ